MVLWPVCYFCQRGRDPGHIPNIITTVLLRLTGLIYWRHNGTCPVTADYRRYYCRVLTCLCEGLWVVTLYWYRKSNNNNNRSYSLWLSIPIGQVLTVIDACLNLRLKFLSFCVCSSGQSQLTQKGTMWEVPRGHSKARLYYGTSIELNTHLNNSQYIIGHSIMSGMHLDLYMAVVLKSVISNASFLSYKTS